MSDDIERRLGRPLKRESVEQQLGKPLRPALPEPEVDLDDAPLAEARAEARPLEHWPDEEAAPPSERMVVTEGKLLETAEWYFPLVWAAAVIIVSYIGIYHAVEQITAHNPLPPNFGA
jgi:hypothetical protein